MVVSPALKLRRVRGTPVTSALRGFTALVFVGLLVVLPAGAASASNEIPPPTGIYFCYVDMTISADNPVIELSIPDRTVLFPSGVYTSSPPC